MQNDNKFKTIISYLRDQKRQYQIQIMSDFALLSIMKYLKENNLQESWISLQNESQVRLFTYPKEIEFFRKIILKGDFQESIAFIKTLQPFLDEKSYNESCLAIYKQKLYELINVPNQKELKNLFQKEIINFCSQEEFQHLFALLTCRRTQQIRGLGEWTVTKGRLKVFEQLLPVIESLLYQNKCKSYLTPAQPSINLDEAMAIYLEVFNNKMSEGKSNLLESKSKLSDEKSKLSGEKSKLEDKSKLLQDKSKFFDDKSKIQEDKGKIQDDSSIINSKITNKDNNNSIVSRKSQAGQMRISKIPEDKKEIQLQLSQSNYERSMVGVFDKKSRLYTNNISNMQQNESQRLTRSNQRSAIKQTEYYNPKHQYSGSKLYHQEQINQIQEEQQRSDTNGQNQMIDRSRRSFEMSGRSKQLPSNEQEKNIQPVAKKYLQINFNKSQYNPSNQEEEIIEQPQSHHNMEYLQQTNSVVYNQPDRDHENFTFSHQTFTAQVEKPRRIVKLSAISDNKAIRTCQFSSTGSYFAVGTNSSILRIFDVESLFQENKYKQLMPIYQIYGLHSKSIFCLDWAKDQTSMVTCSNDLTIKLTQFSPQLDSHEFSMIGRHEACIRMVKFNQEQNKIFSCGDDSLIKVWDMGKVKRCYNLKGHSAGVSAFKVCQNRNELYSVSKDSTIKRWDLRTLQCTATSKHQKSEITFIANNTEKIVASNRNGNVLFFDHDLNLDYEVKIHEEEIRSIEACKNQDLYITASFDGHVGMFSQKSIHSPDYFQHNENSEDKVVFATFLDHPQYKGFASTSTLGLCHIYSYF